MLPMLAVLVSNTKSGSRLWRLSLYSILAATAANPTIAFAPTRYNQRIIHRGRTTYPHAEAMTTRQPLSSTTKNASTGLSPRVLDTLDPCVVLMKELIGRYAHLWSDKGGIFSLAQGVVYWDPPESCQEALREEISKPKNILHTYGPAQGIPELTAADHFRGDSQSFFLDFHESIAYI